MKMKSSGILLGVVMLAPMVAMAKPVAPPRPRTAVMHDHAPKPHAEKTTAPHK